jgi:gliding motility-associated lipoprotein GldD
MMHQKMLLLIISIMIFVLAACNSAYTPKPKGYFKIDFPQHQYQVFNQPGFPYTFEYPVYGKVVQDSTFFEDQPENPYWVNIEMPQFGGKVYISYSQIGGRSRYKIRNAKGAYIDSIGINTFDRLISGAYNLTFKHSYKATSITDSNFVTPNNIQGIFFKIGGNAATANQFLVTDSVKNFLRGALYFDATPNEDSLSIVNQFLLQDMRHLVNSLKWKEQ